MRLVLAMAAAMWTAPAAEPPSQYAKVDGVRVHYKSYGTGSPAVVLIHGWTCDMTFWRAQIPALAAKRRVIAVDLPGHGASDKPEINYTQDLFARAVNAVLEEAALDKAVLVGHSMGAPVGRQFYRRYPEKTAAYVVVDAALRWGSANDQEGKKRSAAFEERLKTYRQPNYRELVAPFIDSMFSAATPNPMREEIKRVMLSAPPYVMESAMRGMSDPALWKEDPIRVPSLVIVARRPSLPKDSEAHLRKLMPKLEYQEWDGVGHFLMMEQPERFNSALIAFLDRL